MGGVRRYGSRRERLASKESTAFPDCIPQLVVDFEGVGGQAPGAVEEVEVVVSDDFVIEGGKIRNDRFFLAGGEHEFVMKFDVGAYAGRVVFATLRLVGADQPNPVASSLDLILLDSGDWSESSVTMSSLPAGVEYNQYMMHFSLAGLIVLRKML